MCQGVHDKRRDDKNKEHERSASKIVSLPEEGCEAQLKQQDRELGSKKDLLEHLTGRVDLFTVHSQQVVRVNNVPQGEKDKACDRNNWYETCKDHYDREDCQLLGIIEPI
jgi:hypothetical protein